MGPYFFQNRLKSLKFESRHEHILFLKFNMYFFCVPNLRKWSSTSRKFTETLTKLSKLLEV